MASKQSVEGSSGDFRVLFDRSPQPTWVYDIQTHGFLEVNQAAERLYGFTRDEFLAMRLDDVRAAAVDASSPEYLELPHLQIMIGQAKHRLKGGGLIDVEVTTRNIQYEGRPAAIAVLTDITHRRQLEAQLRQSQRMEAVGMLAGGIAHDFNNLLTIISGYSQLLLNNIPVGDVNRVPAEQIQRAGDRAAALTRQLLTFSRSQAIQPKILDLNLLISSVSVMLRRVIGEDVDLVLELDPNLGRISADPGQIEQVIMNLVVNSRDAMPEGGRITIQTANIFLDDSYAGTHIAVKPGPYVMLSVTDSGTGMDEETRIHAFEPFFTTKERGKGTGLGLSTVFGIVKQSGGNLEVQSRLGAGTSFRIYLPRIHQIETVNPRKDEAKTPPGSETILLVEDEDMVLTLVRETLKREGYKILDASDAARASRICETYRGKIHLLITDVVMPRTNGRDLAERLCALRPEMKVLYMSGYTDHAVSTGMVQEGLFLQKPFTPGALARKVREVLEGNGGKTWRAGKCD